MSSDAADSAREGAVGGDDRDALVHVLVRALRWSDGVNSDLDLDRVTTLADFRAVAPLLDRAAHARRVESKLGFGLAPKPANLLDERARPEVVVRWRRALAAVDAPTLTSVVRLGRHPIGRVDRVFEGDLVELAPGAELTTLVESAAPDAIVDRVRAAAPELLVVPSLAVIGWLERSIRLPLERAVPSLWALMAEHDHGTTIRSRLPRLHAGRFTPTGRVGLPGDDADARAWTLSVDTCVLELLEEGNPDQISRGRSRVVLPEHASLGRRYELVVSGPSGTVRRRSGIDVRVVGFEPRSSRGLPRVRPRVVDIPPPPGDLALDGVTLPGSWVTSAIRQAFRPEDPALVDARAVPDVGSSRRPRASAHDSDVFDGTELAGLADVEREAGAGRATGFIVHVEVQGATDPRFPDGLEDRIDAALRRRSGAYEFLRGRGDLARPRVRMRPGGSAVARRVERIRRLHGRVDQPPIRVGPPEPEL